MNRYFEDSQPLEEYAASSMRGGALSVVARGITAATQIGLVLFLARLLTPEDYGLVSMVAGFTGFAPILTDFGVRDAVTQRTRITHAEVTALFWFTMAVGVGFTLIVAASGPLVARFYGEPRLTMIVLASSLTFVACALMVQHSALMRRALMFRELAVIEVGANILSAGSALAVAFYGYGYWALVLRPLATPTLISLGQWFTCRWLPGKPALDSGVLGTLKFGSNITGFALLDFASKSSDRIAIGYSRGASVLGQYQNALFIYDNFLDVLVTPLHGVAVASLSKLRGNLFEMRKMWGKALSAMAFYAMPAFGLLALTGGDLVVAVLGAKWQSAGTLISVLALRGIPHSLERTLGWLHVAAGRTDRLMRWGLFATCGQLVVLICGLPFGPMGVVIAYVVLTFAIAVPTIVYAGRPIGITAADVTRNVWRQMLASLVAAGIGFLLRWTVFTEMYPLIRVGALGFVYAVAYLVIVVAILRVHAPVRAAQSLLRNSVPARFAHLVN